MCTKQYLILAPALVALLAGCPTRDISKLDPSPAIESKNEIPVSSNRNIDILFVIDDSDSMQQEQDSLALNFPKFIDVLNNTQGGLPNVHIAVVSSDMGLGMYDDGDVCHPIGDNGLMQNTPHGACKAPNAGARFIEDLAVANGRKKNYDGNLSDVFTCVAKLGVKGCGFEQHLESMKRSLDGSVTENVGFLRQDAYLAVIIMGDEDDCSARDVQVFDTNPLLDNILSMYGVYTSYRCTEFGVSCDGMPLGRAAASYTSCTPRGDSYLWHPQHYYEFLRTLKGDPNLLIGAVIAGNPTPFAVTLDKDGAPQLAHSCSSANGVADPGVRLKYFVDQFGQNGIFTSICQADLTDPLTKIAKLLARKIGTPCLEGDLDTTDIDPTMPGSQINCQVSDVKFPNTSNVTETVLPRCAMTDATTPKTDKVPCWWTTVDNTSCKASTTHIALKVERGGMDAPIGTTEVAKCVLKE